MSSYNRCPTNFIIEEDCCVSTDLTVDSIRSDNINNGLNIQTKNLHVTEGYITSLYLNNAQIVTKQTVTPTITKTGTGITGASLVTNSTDISGEVMVAGTPLLNETVTVTFHEPYPSGTFPIVVLTAAGPYGSNSIGVTGVITTSSSTNFIILFTAAATVTAGANPSFFYRVICPVPA